MKRSSILALSLVMATLSACANTTEGAGKAATQYIEATVKGDSESLFKLLPTATQERVAELHKTLQKIESLIQKYYRDVKQRNDALAAANVDQLKSCDTTESFFALVVSSKDKPDDSGLWGDLGRQLFSVSVDGTKAQAKTLANDSFELNEDNGRWTVNLSETDSSRLESLINEAKKNLANLQNEVKNIEVLRYGTSQ